MGRAAKKVGTPQTFSMNRSNTGLFYHGNVSSRVFHGPGCRHYDSKNCTAVFKSKEEGMKAGYRSHEECVE